MLFVKNKVKINLELCNNIQNKSYIYIMVNDLNLTVMEKQTYVTLWSKSGYNNDSKWVVERTHSADYIAATVGLRSFDEFVQINGRLYKIMPEGVNPNLNLLATV